MRELVKYVVKPAELTDGPRPLDPAEARWLFESLFRLNLAQPLGGFREFWKGLAEAGQKVVTVRTASGKRVLRVAQKATRLDHSRRDREEARKGVPDNMILGVTLPMWSHTPWAEPMILVQRYQPRAVGEAAMERLREIEFERMYARQLWDASGAPDPRVALAVAQAWRERGSKSNVTPFRAPSAEGARYTVHTSSLTVRPEGTGREAAGKTDPPHPPPDGGQVVLLERPGGPPIDLGAADIDIPQAS